MSNSLINSIVYEKGIETALKNKFAVLLLTEKNEVVATSACINEAGGVNELFLPTKLKWDNQEKTITLDKFEFEETRSGLDLGETDQVAVKFAVVKLEASDYEAKEEPAYGTQKSYKWPKFNMTISPKEENIYFSGDIQKPVTIQKGNNFRFQKVEIKLSEIQNI